MESISSCRDTARRAAGFAVRRVSVSKISYLFYPSDRKFSGQTGGTVLSHRMGIYPHSDVVFEAGWIEYD